MDSQRLEEAKGNEESCDGKLSNDEIPCVSLKLIHCNHSDPNVSDHRTREPQANEGSVSPCWHIPLQALVDQHLLDVLMEHFDSFSQLWII